MEENNKIIAEFMGFTFEKNLGYYDNEMLLEQIVYEQQNGNCFNELLFDKSWDWLMSVIEKIRNNHFVTNVNYNTGGDFIIEGLTSTEVLNIIINREDFKSDLEMCYFGVVEFIKWYNQNKEKEN